MANEVRVPLTEDQKAKIKAATGKDVPEIRVESFGKPDHLANSVSTKALARGMQAKALAKGVSTKALARGMQAKALAKGISTKALAKGLQAKALAKSVSARKA